MQHDDFLFALLTEELPSKQLKSLGQSLVDALAQRLKAAELNFDHVQFFVAPRHLAVLVSQLQSTQKDSEILRKGPAIKAAFNAAGEPTQASLGFARSVKADVTDLIRIENDQGEWVGYREKKPGQPVTELLPDIVNETVATLPIAKKMYWHEGEIAFVRPVHAVVLLYGDQVVPCQVLGLGAGRKIRGHRFLANDWLTITHASQWETLLETEGFVVSHFEKRRNLIRTEVNQAVENIDKANAKALMSDELLDEVTGLVEWPQAAIGQFDEAFLALPKEVLVSAMQDHQRYFPVMDGKGALLPYFIITTNTPTKTLQAIIQGNENVLRARLSDAAFFYAADQKLTLDDRITRLKGIVFQAKLGTLYDKSERLSAIAACIAPLIKADERQAQRAGMLAKTDLTTDMVNEFPELQGIMGDYYAQHDGESPKVAIALREQYLPRFADDQLPESPLGQALAVSDRVDTLVGTFGINQIPTGDKDPFGLRRAAIGLLRILIEKNLNINLKTIFQFALNQYTRPLPNPNTLDQLMFFIQERLRTYYLERDIAPDVFAAVAALQIDNPLDVDKRVKAVQAFKQLNEAEALSIAHKRVSHILAKYVDKIDATQLNPDLFEDDAEAELARQLMMKRQAIANLYETDQYDEVLLSLAELRKPIDDFFDHVMVMTDNKAQRENRILLLSQLRALFLQVADIALLQ